MKASKKSFYLYSLLWALYYMQGILYESGGMLSRTLLIIVMAFSAYYVYYAIPHYRMSQYMKGLNILLSVITIYGFIRLFGGTYGYGKYAVLPYGFLQLHYMSIMPIYAFYTFAKKGLICDVEIKRMGYVFLAVCISFYFKTFIEFTQYTEHEEITNNSAYMFVSLAAIIPLMKVKNVYKYLLLAVAFAFVLLSAKRGAILIMTICTIEFFTYMLRNAKRKNKTIVVLMISSLILIGYNLAYRTISHDEFLQSRIEETLVGDTSGRDVIYRKLIKHITDEGNLFHLLFGNGADSTFLIAGNAAHNDWLEIMINMGIFGIIIYIIYWIGFLQLYRRLKMNKELASSLLMVITLCLLRTLFSMSINDMFVITSFIIGYSVSIRDNIRMIRVSGNVKNKNSQVFVEK